MSFLQLRTLRIPKNVSDTAPIATTDIGWYGIIAFPDFHYYIYDPNIFGENIGPLAQYSGAVVQNMTMTQVYQPVNQFSNNIVSV